MAKEKVICDSDVIIDYWNINSKRHSDTKHILEDEIGLNNVALAAVTKMELVVGATNKHELARINKNIHQFNILLINDEITQLTIQLLQDYNLSHGLALPDALIAATAVITRFEIFTYNLKDYKFIKDIKLFDPQKHQAKNK